MQHLLLSVKTKIMGANKKVILYFRDRMRDAGYESKLGYNVPDFAKAPKNKISIELWISNGESQMWENTEIPLEAAALIECYVYRVRNSSDNEGQWYDDVEEVLNTLAENKQVRPQSGKVWWDNRIIPVDFVSPLKRWNNSSEYGAGFLCARIDLQINYLTNI